MNAPSIRALLEKPRPSPVRAPGQAQTAEVQGDDAAEYEPYASGRIGSKPQLTLTFCLASGAVRGFSYSFFYSVEADDRAAGFVVDFTNTKVKVTGRNLQHLFRLVCDHRVVEIVELGRSQRLEAADDEPVVEQLEFMQS